MTPGKNLKRSVKKTALLLASSRKQMERQLKEMLANASPSVSARPARKKKPAIA